MLKAMAGSAPVLVGTTGNIGGSLLLVGAASTGTANVPGAQVGMVAMCCPNTFAGDAYPYDCYVSAPDTVTVKVRAIIAGIPPVSTYNVRVIL